MFILTAGISLTASVQPIRAQQRLLQKLAASEVAATNKSRTVLLVSPSDGAYPEDGEGIGNEVLLPHSYTPTFSIATGRDSGHLYTRGLDDENWIKVYDEIAFTVVWGLSNGNILGYYEDHAHTDQALYVSTDAGATFHKVIDTDGSTLLETQFSSSASLVNWSLGESGDGRVLLAEYGPRVFPADPPGRGNRIFFSGDCGETWNQIWDQVVEYPDPADRYHHHHAVGHVNGPDRFVVACGDGIARRRTLTVAGDGSSVDVLIPPGASFLQPTWFLPLDGENNEDILYGADSPYQIGILNVRTGQYRSVYQGLDRRGMRSYIWLMWKYDGVYYAGQTNQDQGRSGRPPPVYESVILVAQNPAGPWAVYDRPPKARIILKYAGVSNGVMNIAFYAPGGERTQNYHLSPASVQQVEAVVVEPERENRLTADYSYDVGKWYVSNGSESLGVGEGIDGGDCVKWTSSGDCTMSQYRVLYGPGVPPDTAWQASAWIRADSNVPLNTHLVLGDADIDEGDKTPIRVALEADTWTHVDFPVVTPVASDPAVSGELNVGMAFRLEEYPNCRPRTFWIDKPQIEQAPSTSTIPGATMREANRLDRTYNVGANWTNLFYFTPQMSGYLVAFDMFSLTQDTKL